MSLIGFRARNHQQQVSTRGARDEVDDRETDPRVPPYSHIEPWIRKAFHAIDEEGAEIVVMLIPANRTEQRFWQDLVEPARDRPDGRLRVEFLRGRLRFLEPGEQQIRPNSRPPFGVCLLVFTPAKEANPLGT